VHKLPKISIIVPIYNSAGTLSPCLQAVANQSFQDYELLLCDDGSLDQSMEISRSAAGQDSRLRILPLNHAGVSAARNAGLELAQGRYLAFLDSDDIPSPDWLSTLWENARPDGLSVCGYTVKDISGSALYGTEQTQDSAELTPKQFLEDLFSNRLMYQGYVWNKLFSRALVEADSPLRFDEKIHYNEDRLFLFWYLWRCTGINYTATSQYDYIQKPSTSTYRPEMQTELDAFEIMCKQLAQSGLNSALYYAEKDRSRATTALCRLAGQTAGALQLKQEEATWQKYL